MTMMQQIGSHLWLLLALGLLLLLTVTCLLVYRLYLLPLRRLLSDTRAMRYNHGSGPISTAGRGLFAQLAHEINLLHRAFTNARKEILQARNNAEKKVIDSTKNLRYAIRRLEKTAYTDNLTGLANRACLDRNLLKLFEQAQQNETELVCLMIDLDHFKAINDKLGHLTGDEVIAFVGQILRACTRPDDVAARYGGDEFAVLLPNCSRAKAKDIAERVRLIFAYEAGRFTSKQRNCTVTATALRTDKNAIAPRLSIGLATLQENRPENPQKLLQMADQALYKAKNTGKNNVVTR